jgi:putative hemolysin
MIDVEALLDSFYPELRHSKKRLYRTTASLLKKILHEKEINQFIDSHRHLVGLEFLDSVLDHFDFKYSLSNRDRANIPAQGRVIIVANHPLGSLDGLALLKMVSEIRPDVKIVATTVLSRIKPLESLFLSVDNTSKKSSHFRSLKNILAELEQDRAIIMFPTGEVSRIRPHGVRDGKWKSGFVRLAFKSDSPILPIYINGKNSKLFYSMSALYKPLGTLLLVKEMFKQHEQQISFTVGKPVPLSSLQKLDMKPGQLAKRMRKQVYRLARNMKKPLFDTIQNIVHPMNKKSIRDELKQSELIGSTQDGKQIYLFDYQSNSSVIREIGRLRELSFRQVQEGTGNAIDIDEFDRYYRHLVLWDDNDLEIVGTYRIGEGLRILTQKGYAGFYSHTLFDMQDELIPYLEKSIELGRSFVQPRYWGKRSLDYLWYGIGAYLQRHPEVEYMIGPVSLSASYPEPAKQAIVKFYSTLFGRDDQLVKPRLPYKLADQNNEFDPFSRVTEMSQYKKAYAQLKYSLDRLGVRVPALYKQYVEVCNPGGCEFLGFNVDPDFSNCIDAMILVYVDEIQPRKRERYILSHQKQVEKAA